MKLERNPRWGWTQAALRIVAGIQTLLVGAQAALAGQFLSGSSAARAYHRDLGTEVITWMALISLVFAILAWRPGRHKPWPVILTGAGLAAVILQLGYGFDGRVEIHIPLGLGIFALYLIVVVGFTSGAANHSNMIRQTIDGQTGE